MLPGWLLPTLLTLGGGASSLFAQGQRQAQFKRVMDMIRWSQNPQNVLGETKGLYQGMLQSPMFAAARNDVMQGAQRAQSALAGQMVGSGVTGGMNSMVKAMGTSLPANAMTNLRGGLWQSALNTTQQNIAQRINAAQGTLYQPGPMENTVGSIFGAMAPLLRYWMMQPGGGGKLPKGLLASLGSDWDMSDYLTPRGGR